MNPISRNGTESVPYRGIPALHFSARKMKGRKMVGRKMGSH
jgi:hypothetical protein